MRGTTGTALAAVAVVAAVGAGSSPAAAAPVACGSVVTSNLTLRADLVGCSGDGLVVGANGIRIDLNGHEVSGLKAPGSVGIRNVGHNGVRIESSKPFGTISEFDVGISVTGASRTTVSKVLTRATRLGIRLERADRALVVQSDVGFAELVPSCDPATAPAAIVLVDTASATLRDNYAQLSGYGILLLRSGHNVLRGNGAAPTSRTATSVAASHCWIPTATP